MKILSIDGGGIRGLIPAIMLAQLETLTQRPIAESFDLIAGTSIGGILALGLAMDDGSGNPKYTAKELVELMKQNGELIFNRSLWHQVTSMESLIDEKYENAELVKLLRSYFGEATLLDTVTEVAIPAYETERRTPWFFKSKHAKNGREGYNHKLLDVALATSAAPTYFEPHRIHTGNKDYFSFIDGGIFANNPALCAYADAKKMWECCDEEISIVSIGTGHLTKPLYYDDIKDYGLIEWARPLINCTFDGVANTADYQLRQILPKNNYFRFQPQLREGNEDLDNISDKNIRALQLLAENIMKDQGDQVTQVVELMLREEEVSEGV